MQPSEEMPTRYNRLCQAYVQLSDKFQKLDVDYMNLRRNVVPLLKALKGYKHLVEQLKQDKKQLEERLQSEVSSLQDEKQSLELKLQAMSQDYETIKALEMLMQPEMLEALVEAEEQIELVDTTIQEMESDRDPDLSSEEKALLNEYCNDPTQFVMNEVEGMNGSAAIADAKILLPV